MLALSATLTLRPGPTSSGQSSFQLYVWPIFPRKRLKFWLVMNLAWPPDRKITTRGRFLPSRCGSNFANLRCRPFFCTRQEFLGWPRSFKKICLVSLSEKLVGWSVVAAYLVERSLPTTQVGGSNHISDIIEHLPTELYKRQMLLDMRAGLANLWKSAFKCTADFFH